MNFEINTLDSEQVAEIWALMQLLDWLPVEERPAYAYNQGLFNSIENGTGVPISVIDDHREAHQIGADQKRKEKKLLDLGKMIESRGYNLSGRFFQGYTFFEGMLSGKVFDYAEVIVGTEWVRTWATDGDYVIYSFDDKVKLIAPEEK